MQNIATLEDGGEAMSNEVEASLCLVCDVRLGVSDSLNIFYTSLPRNGELLASFVLRVLRPTAADLCSSHICLRCYDLFRSLEQAQWTASNVKGEILRVYRSKSDATREKMSLEEMRERQRKDENPSARPDDIRYSTRPDAATLDTTEPDFKIEDAISTHEHHKDLADRPFRHYKSNYAIEDDTILIRSISATPNDSPIYPSKNASNQVIVGCRELSPTTEPTGDTASTNEASSRRAIQKSKVPDDPRSRRVLKYSQKPLKYNCDTCDKKWRTSAELKTHVKSHSSLRPYMCEKCGQAYKHKNALEIHVGMHNGVSPFKCDICDKCFTQKGALMRHLPMHSGETPYQCELCGKRFVHHTSYNMHALSHTGKKSYQCHVCNLSLLSTSHLKRHMRVHTGEKPYSCSLCGKSFAERYNLFAHQKIHDPTEIMARAARKILFKCDRCNEHFDKKQKLAEHAIEHTSNGSTSENTLMDRWIDMNPTEIATAKTDDRTKDTWRRLDYEKTTDSHLLSQENYGRDRVTIVSNGTHL